MPGVIGLFGSGSLATEETLSRMLSALHAGTGLQTVRCGSRLGQFACTHHGLFDHSVLATTPQRDVGVLLDGWVWNSPGMQTGGSRELETDVAQACLEAYLSRGVDFVRQLNGEFNIVVWDEREGTTWLLNDRYGLRPMQFGFFNGALFFAPEGKAVLAGARQTPVLDMLTVINWLSVGRALLGDRTFFEGVAILPPASVFCYRDGRLQRNTYWDYVYDPIELVDDAFVKELADAFCRAVARRVRLRRRFGITLSGGLDSRVVAHALAASTSTPIVACTFGMPDSDEVLLAKAVAERLGMSWLCIPLKPEDFLSHAEEGVRFTEGLEILVQSYGLTVFPQLRREAEVAFTGLALDLTMGGSYLHAKLVDPSSNETEARQHVFDGLSYFDAEMVGQLFGSATAVHTAEKLFSESWDRDRPGVNNADRADRFALRYRVRRTTFTRQTWQRLFLEDANPTFDNEFIDLLLRLPATERLGHRFYQCFMSHLCPELMDIPYQRTLLPPAAPVDMWGRAVRIEEERERLFTDVWKATNGRVYLPYKRYSTNYDEWLRTDSRWMAFTDMLLCRGDSRVAQIGIRMEPIHRMLREHRNAQRSHRARLLQVLTLELFLRVFFG